MKKYGDDADQFHNQGTRVEESKKWHEQNQLRHDYSYRSVPKPKSTYEPKYVRKYYERDHPDRLICEVCGSVYNKHKYARCPHCYHESSKSERQYRFSSGRQYTESSHGISLTTCPTCGRKIIAGILCPLCHITCPRCGKRYNKHLNSNCPYCKTSKPKLTSKSTKVNLSYTPNYDKNERNKHRFNENNRKSGSDNFILGLCIGLFILFLIFAFL